ncbi:LLM class flavin-dependent oxidoreductase [Nocardia gipuzkoensis]|uniref:LLM class flavin-dependent oxidoreductase n=1 Tax=Nocardia gipuzkoensis TaxID=2749991 RepID=UPI00237D6CE8|nr:LLM class flavin-dependent oxidoreductase [Nocardia gipuzkoensis]MDE1674755.1 LLM class flavin-dependent oxidoreductase [Nocardia gipuzkoensis]
MEVAVMVDSETGMSAASWLALAELADRTELDALVRSDHYAGTHSSQLDCLDAWSACAAAAARTSRIALGTLVSPITFRHPAVLAKTVATVCALGGNRRVDVGIGLGWNSHEHAVAGLAFPAAAIRYRMVEEYLTVLRALWAEGPGSFSGQYYTLASADFHPKPTPAPRIIIGKRGRPRSLALAAAHADEYNLVFQPAEACTEIRRRLHELAEQLGRATPRLSIMTDFILGRDNDEITARLATAAIHNPRLVGADATTLPAPYLAGKPADLLAALRNYRDHGVDRVILKHPDPTDLASIELLATHVLPHLAQEG